MEEIEVQEKPALKVFKAITVVQEPGMVMLEVSFPNVNISFIFPLNFLFQY